jgi:peptidylprolyl isomerase
VLKRGFAAALLLAAIGLTACGDDDTPTATTSPVTTSTAVPTSSPTSGPTGSPSPATDLTQTPSGLQYRDEVVGTGERPKTGDCIAVHYTGRLDDGTEFDSSRGGRPFTFFLGAGNVIAGWDEGLATMQVGGKRVLVIPPDLGYGANGFPPVIPPNATLTFDVELMGIRQPAACQ